jgi:hypothetical protein
MDADKLTNTLSQKFRLPMYALKHLRRLWISSS